MTYKYRTAVANEKRNENLKSFRFFFSFSEVTISKGGYALGHNHEHDQSLYQNKRS